MAVFVLDKQKRPLMPCTEKRARLLLQRRRAVVVSLAPFTIRLKDRIGGAVQPLRLKLDDGVSRARLMSNVRHNVRHVRHNVRHVRHNVRHVRHNVRQWRKWRTLQAASLLGFNVRHVRQSDFGGRSASSPTSIYPLRGIWTRAGGGCGGRGGCREWRMSGIEVKA